MTYYKSLDGLWAQPKLGTRYRYPGLWMWTRPHLPPHMLEVGSFGYHLGWEQGVMRRLGPDIYEAEPCPVHPVEYRNHEDPSDLVVTCQVRLIRRTLWRKDNLPENGRALWGIGMENAPIQLTWRWDSLNPGVRELLTDWFEGRRPYEELVAEADGWPREFPYLRIPSVMASAPIVRTFDGWDRIKPVLERVPE